MPIPIPTPTPSNEVTHLVQAVENTVDKAVQQGVVGVLLLFAVIGLVLAIAYLLRIYFRRNAKPDDTGLNNAILALGAASANRDEEAKLDRQEREAERAEWRRIIEQQMGVMNTNQAAQTNAMQTVAASQTDVAASLKKLSGLTQTMQQDLSAINTVGSPPLQGLITMVTNIEAKLDEIKTKLLPCEEIQSHANLYEPRFLRLESDVEALKTNMAGRVEQKRQTDTIPTVSSG